jgi:FHA domain
MSAGGGTALRLAPGTGVLSRRGTALLYVREHDPVLVGAFATSEPAAELQALASATVAAGFEVGPFVGLAWDGGLRVMAFGDIALETDQPSLPMLSGAGSRTWVEHTVALPDGRAVVTVGGDAADASTDLVAGTVFAGGFRLELGVASAIARAEEAQARVDETRAVPRLAPPGAVAAEDIAPDAPPEVAPDVAPEDAPETAPVPTADVARDVAPDVDVDDPSAALAAIQAAAVGADGVPVEPAGTAGAEPEPHDPDVTLPPPVSEALLADVREDVTDSRGSLVDAKLCRNGHANPPTAATCAVCAEFLAPGTSSVVHVPRPSLGRLQLDDGELVDLDRELLFGRNPDRDDDPARAGLRRVKVLGEKVSRSHLEVRLQGWDVLVADLGSTNGTFVVPHPGGQVAALESGRAQLVEAGAVVYFGSRSFTVLGRGEG